MAKEPTAYQLSNAISALQRAKEALLAEDPDIAEDSLLLQNMLEGDLEAGDAMDTVHRVMQAAVQADDFVAMLKGRAKRMTERGMRWQARSAALRNAAMMALEALELRRITFDDLTASIAGGSPHVQITDEDALPDEYFRVKREPNKTMIGDALRAGKDVEGATMSNASDSLRIKTT